MTHVVLGSTSANLDIGISSKPQPYYQHHSEELPRKVRRTLVLIAACLTNDKHNPNGLLDMEAIASQSRLELFLLHLRAGLQGQDKENQQHAEHWFEY